MLRAVLFDLDETLIPEDEPLATAYRAVAGALGTDVASLRAGLRARWQRDAPCPDYRARVHVSASDGLIAEFTGADPVLAAIRAYLPRFRAEAFPDPQLVALWQRIRVEAQTVYPLARATLERLRRDVRLGLVTNGTSDLQRRKLALAGLDPYFGVVVASCDIGTGKPDPAIFHAALAALGVTAAEAVMVGDDRDRDIQGAANAGLPSVLIERGDLRGLPERIAAASA
jgi:putative hydrolase of the HAD superfamily